jgi:biopolymer transport protein ExbD
MKFRRKKNGSSAGTLMMTPMIDIVFQLLVFFLLTFKIVSPEGDFNIFMPQSAPAQGQPDQLQLPALKLRMIASDSGELAGMFLGEKQLQSFQQLHSEIVSLVGDDTGPGSIAADTEIELDTDYNLKYKYVIEAITAVSGKVEGGHIIRLIEKIKFATPGG